ncbi:hypothetical protein H4R27_000703 [Coemansia aciculifera]|nr:hypothetical protein H4R27_000703 [Coemansia aciculifera]
MPTGVTKAKLPAHVISNYSPMAKRFRCWLFQDFLVALACPNFDYSAPPPAGIKKYREKLEETIATRGFKKHAPRLGRLLFHSP